MKKETKWVRFRHKIYRPILHFFLGTYCVLKYGVKVERFKEEKGRKYLVLFNHQTAFDQFFVEMSFRQPIYFVASEDIFSIGWLSSVIKHLVAPIPIRKQTTDIQAIRSCIKVAKEGGTIAIAPEGNRTYHGKQVYINPTIAYLAKKIGLPIALYRIEGGYGVHPRWSDVVRRGKMRTYVSNVIEPEEYMALSNDELADLITRELNVDEGKSDGVYRHKKNAEFLERAMYVCPYCGLSEFESNGDIIECKKCHIKIRHLPTKELEGIGFEFPFRFVSEWYDYQCDFVNQYDILSAGDEPVYSDTVRLSEVIVYKNKKLISSEAPLAIYSNKIRLGDMEIAMSEITGFAVLGKNKLNIYHDKKVYQIKGDKRFNALKYLNLFYRYKNLTTGDGNGKFLGL